MSDTNEIPLLTIGVLSWNRLYYLRATLESARRCIKYPNIQWIIVDNCSNEPGLEEYLKSLDWVNELVFLKSDHVNAMNEVLARARGEVLLMWPDDVQFIVEGNWMVECIDVLMKNDWIGSMSLNSLRRSTIQRIWGGGVKSYEECKSIWTEFKRYGTGFRFQRKIISSRGFPVFTYGWKEDGIIGSGIPSLTRMDVWKTLGPWKTKVEENNIIDSSHGGESEMLERWLRRRIPWQRAMPLLPVSADILTDPTGTKAKVRGKHRYGVYTPPNGDFYYKIHNQVECEDWMKNPLPTPFEDFVIPIRFDLPLDENGNLLKASLNLSIKTSIIK